MNPISIAAFRTLALITLPGLIGMQNTHAAAQTQASAPLTSASAPAAPAKPLSALYAQQAGVAARSAARLKELLDQHPHPQELVAAQAAASTDASESAALKAAMDREPYDDPKQPPMLQIVCVRVIDHEVRPLRM